MTCIHYAGAIICTQPFYRLPLDNGRRVFMEWHSYLGPTFFHDRNATREIVDWYENPSICRALDWFTGRGNKA